MYSKADTHMHTTYSDGLADPATMVDYIAEATDLAVIAVTDHDTAEGGLAAREHALRRGYRLQVIVGQEVTTLEGDVVGLFVHTTLPAYRTAREAIDAIHAQGGLAVAVHPYSAWNTANHMTGVGRLIHTLPLDGVEVRNGFPSNVFANPFATWQNRRGQGLSELGGSDSHAPYTVGQAFTSFPGETAEDLRQAIQQRSTHADGSLWRLTSLVRVAGYIRRYGLPERKYEPSFADGVDSSRCSVGRWDGTQPHPPTEQQSIICTTAERCSLVAQRPAAIHPARQQPIRPQTLQNG